jgi:hypothetical protein
LDPYWAPWVTGRDRGSESGREAEGKRENKRHSHIGKERRGSGEESTESLESKVLDP